MLLEHITGDDKRNGAGLIGQAARRRIAGGGGARCAPLDQWRRRLRRTRHASSSSVGRGKEQRAFEARLRPQPDGTLLIVTRDTTERRKAKARIEYLAYYDILTGLPNRQLFVREVGRAIRAAKQSGQLIALLYLDLDRFKRINDNLGHSVGDALLQNVARRLEQSARPDDSAPPVGERRRHEQARIARLGGDEFVVLLTGLSDEAQTAAVANRIRHHLAEPIDCGGHRLVVTPSIGIALVSRAMPPTSRTCWSRPTWPCTRPRIRAATAMRSTDTPWRCARSAVSSSKTDLRSAFENGDFRIFYQPKVELASGVIIGVEALLRWHHATRGWIAPDVFIPVAEETGLIAALGDWVILEACKQLHLWSRAGPWPPDHRRQRIGAAVRALEFRRLGAARAASNTTSGRNNSSSRSPRAC